MKTNSMKFSAIEQECNLAKFKREWRSPKGYQNKLLFQPETQK